MSRKAVIPLNCSRTLTEESNTKKAMKKKQSKERNAKKQYKESNEKTIQKNNTKKIYKKQSKKNIQKAMQKIQKKFSLTFPNVARRGRPGERDALLLLRSFEVEHRVTGSQPFQDQGQMWLRKQQKLQNFTFWVYRSVRTRVFLCGPFDNI